MKTIKSRSKAQEKKTAKELKGKTTPASGSLWSFKGDVRSDRLLVECKTTKKDFYILQYTTWEKIAREALNDGLRIPVMRVDLRESYSDTISFAIVRQKDFAEYIDLSATCTENLSYRIEQPTIINWSNEKITKSWQFVSLAVIPWNEFLDILERWN